jgi:hypothetical protein
MAQRSCFLRPLTEREIRLFYELCDMLSAVAIDVEPGRDDDDDAEDETSRSIRQNAGRVAGDC